MAGVLEDDGAHLRFRHDLIRDAIYEDLPGSVRRALHREAGQRLAQPEPRPYRSPSTWPAGRPGRRRGHRVADPGRPRRRRRHHPMSPRTCWIGRPS